MWMMDFSSQASSAARETQPALPWCPMGLLAHIEPSSGILRVKPRFWSGEKKSCDFSPLSAVGPSSASKITTKESKDNKLIPFFLSLLLHIIFFWWFSSRSLHPPGSNAGLESEQVSACWLPQHGTTQDQETPIDSCLMNVATTCSRSYHRKWNISVNCPLQNYVQVLKFQYLPGAERQRTPL